MPYAVFVGKDEHGTVRHAHKRSVNSAGPGFKRNVTGCDARYSFHYTGTSDRLYVFEAPVDLLSFLTLYQKDWQTHSYAALCGTSEHAMLWMLEQNPNIRNVLLCLDHDAAGIEANGRLSEILRDHGYHCVSVLQPECKDWNENLKAAYGLPALPAEEHPQLAVAPEVCQFIAEKSQELKTDHLGSLEKELPRLLQFFQNHIQQNQIGRATLCTRTKRPHWRWRRTAGNCGSLGNRPTPWSLANSSARVSCPIKTTLPSRTVTGSSAPRLGLC